MKKTLKMLFSYFAVFSLLFVLGTEAMAAKKSKTLKNTQKKDFVRCGVSQGLPGFSNADASGNWTGVDVDVCRAVAAAVLGDAGKVKFTPLSAKERFTALTSGEIDILSRNTTWTLSRDADIGLTFVGVNFYDGQGFMVRKDSGITSTSQFKSGLSACVNIGTTTELNINIFREYFDNPMNSFEIGAAIFRNYYIDKIYYVQLEENLIAPVNRNQAWINGAEMSLKGKAFNSSLKGNSSLTLLSLSEEIIFPNKPQLQGSTNILFDWNSLLINISYFYCI